MNTGVGIRTIGLSHHTRGRAIRYTLRKSAAANDVVFELRKSAAANDVVFELPKWAAHVDSPRGFKKKEQSLE